MMMNDMFSKEWQARVDRIRSTEFWAQITTAPKDRIAVETKPLRQGWVRIDDSWAIVPSGDFKADNPAGIGISDLLSVLKNNFGVNLEQQTAPRENRCIEFVVTPQKSSRWQDSFSLETSADKLRVVAGSEQAILKACLYLGNYWRRNRNTDLKIGEMEIAPRVKIHLGADFWGGFCVAREWPAGREKDTNYLELARMGINAMPIMAHLEDYIDQAPEGFNSLVNPNARDNRKRLAQLARQSAKYGVYIFLMAYNPKLGVDHTVFSDMPSSRGSLQGDGAFRVLCSSDSATREFITNSWASLFEEIPELGGMLSIVGGEGFYHCFMRSDKADASDCPNCSKRNSSEVVAEIVNQTAQSIREANPEARMITWPYSATHWSHDRDQKEFINLLDSQNVIFQTELDKDTIDWRSGGYAKNCWDYSGGYVGVSERSNIQRNLCCDKGIEFSCKIEINNTIECLAVPYLPIHYNHLKLWQNSIEMKPYAIQSRWLFDGACKSVSEELGYWAIWKDSSDCELEDIFELIANREFGAETAGYVLKAWSFFSEAIKHHTSLDYYIGPYLIGPGQPLILDSDNCTSDSQWQFGEIKLTSNLSQELDRVFYGNLYMSRELKSSDEAPSLLDQKKLFYDQPAFKAIVRRGERVGEDIGLEEMKRLAKIWNRGVELLCEAKKTVTKESKKRFRQEYILGRYFGYTWQSAANVEEFLRLRNIIIDHSRSYAQRSGYAKENIRDLDRMGEIASEELQIAKESLELIKGVDFLDLSLRLDADIAPLESIMKAKIKQVTMVIEKGLPQWRKDLLDW